jgi:hypothetical protein
MKKYQLRGRQNRRKRAIASSPFITLNGKKYSKNLLLICLQANNEYKLK